MLLARVRGETRHELYDEAAPAAWRLFVFEQRYLHDVVAAWNADEIASDVLTLEEQHELARTRALVVDAMRWISPSGTSEAEAKRRLISASGGSPLAVCFGHVTLTPIVGGKVHQVTPPGMRSGCGCVFAMSPYIGGRNLFPVYCRKCAGDGRHPLREAAAQVRATAVR